MELKIRENRISEVKTIDELVQFAWSKVSPFWSIKNMIAVNPLKGYEDQPFVTACEQGALYFQSPALNDAMKWVNKETIKWCQAYFDEGQASIQMPLKEEGLLTAILALIRYDSGIHQGNQSKIAWLNTLPNDANKVIRRCLDTLAKDYSCFEKIIHYGLITLPGWASFIKAKENTGLEKEYCAFRLVLMCMFEVKAADILNAFQSSADTQSKTCYRLSNIMVSEIQYRQSLLSKLNEQIIPSNGRKLPDAQFIFCIDVRSEPMRHSIESTGNYETYGFAGFFGLPVSIQNSITAKQWVSCPVLLKPAHTVSECATVGEAKCKRRYHWLNSFSSMYQSIKYGMTTPFALVEASGLLIGAWMALRTLFPRLTNILRKTISNTESKHYHYHSDDLSFSDQCAYAESALRLMGLTERFSKLIVICGHGSESQNNATASSLDCGACAGNHGASNARLLAQILNNKEVRSYLRSKGIALTDEPVFIGGLHNTSTDEISLFAHGLSDDLQTDLACIKANLKKAQSLNNAWRMSKMCSQTTHKRASDWSQLRPEWGLARNASFIIAPRSHTKHLHLDGRSFLHSYNWKDDTDGSLLETIMTAPMVVAHWINMQYFFSTFDNVVYGAGSKITSNVVGKFGLMQGNGSDLMHGLALQSVAKSDTEMFHEPLRLTSVIHAPRTRISHVIEKHESLKNLVKNEWIFLVSWNPEDNQFYLLKPNFEWKIVRV